MNHIIPSEIYETLPCSVVSVGCALHVEDKNRLMDLFSDALHDDGYLSLDGMNALIRSRLHVKRTDYFKRGQRSSLTQFMAGFTGKAVVCLLGHFIYVENGDYYSFFENASDPVVKVWEIA